MNSIGNKYVNMSYFNEIELKNKSSKKQEENRRVLKDEIFEINNELIH